MEPGSLDLSHGLLDTLQQALEQPRKGHRSRGGSQDAVQSLVRAVSLARGYSTSPLPVLSSQGWGSPCVLILLLQKNTLTKTIAKT